MKNRLGMKLASLRMLAVPAALVLVGMTAASTAFAVTELADSPVFSRSSILGNVALALSVEWPTAERAAYPGTNDYSSANTYKGYFDPNKCYRYQYDAAVDLNRYFVPAGVAVNRTCTGANDDKWSGNFLNWAATQTIDPFRLVMTGGYRVRDELALTVLQKANHPMTGNLYPNKNLSTAATIAGATPFAVNSLNMRINGAGRDMLFTVTGSTGNNNAAIPATTDYNPANAIVNATVYRVRIAVQVCNPTAPGGVETNCKQYGSNWKPEGLMQQYSRRLRFAAFGYLNQTGNARDGAVLRARMKYVGPTYPVPSAPDVTNTATEWDPGTGIFVANPDSADAAATNSAYGPATSIVNSGVANYLNKFGQITGNGYKGNDPVSELYYAAQRYFRNIGAVPEWNTLLTSTTVNQALDGFPVIRDWDDPIQYSCQKNFILGIGDIYTHADKNVPGSTGTSLEPTKPASVSGDTVIDAQAATNLAFALQGLSAPNANDYSGRNNSAAMVGLAYWANVNDIRPDIASLARTQGKQTIQTLWVDVLEQPFVTNNQFYLTAKYGGFIPPTSPEYSFANTTPLPDAWWSTNTDMLSGQRRPDNYFTAGNPDQMITGLTKAFQRINALSAAFTTSFSTSLPQVSQLGNASFGAQYDASNWTGEVVASELNFAADGTPSQVERWRAKATLATQLAGTGWNTNRNLVTWSGTAGVPFRTASLTTAQLAALNTPYLGVGETTNVDDSTNYLNYLRGDRTNEAASTVSTSTRAYRTREALLGDIVGSRAKPIGPPSFPLADGLNPGYDAFKILYRNRATVVYVGANDGMLHAFNGAMSGTGAGTEIFGYIPNALFNGPTSPAADGLALLGNVDMDHHYLVNATPGNFDVDFTRTWTGSGVGSGTPDWRSILVGGLGKGGRAYYALDITNPATITAASAATRETVAASKVLWEFTDSRLGFSYGEPVFVKTRKYGWTVILPSGYNNADGSGYILLVNPRTGALLEAVSTHTESTTVDTGLAHINAYVLDYTDGYADAIYGGDLNGNLWRFDISAASGAYPNPIVMARLTDAATGAGQPVTSRPIAELHPKTKNRVVMVGTGKLLSQDDRSSTQEQTFYAIKDGNSVRFNAATDLPPGVTFPIRRTNLEPNQDWVVGVTNAATSSMGFYTDLGRDAASGIAWRVVSDPTSFLGIVAFAPTLPSIADACQPSGISRIYAGDFNTGLSVLINALGAVQGFAQVDDGVVTDLRFLSVGGKPRLITGTDKGSVRQMRGNFGSAVGLRRINWREVNLGN